MQGMQGPGQRGEGAGVVRTTSRVRGFPGARPQRRGRRITFWFKEESQAREAHHSMTDAVKSSMGMPVASSLAAARVVFWGAFRLGGFRV